MKQVLSSGDELQIYVSVFLELRSNPISPILTKNSQEALLAIPAELLAHFCIDLRQWLSDLRRDDSNVTVKWAADNMRWSLEDCTEPTADDYLDFCTSWIVSHWSESRELSDLELRDLACGVLLERNQVEPIVEDRRVSARLKVMDSVAEARGDESNHARILLTRDLENRKRIFFDSFTRLSEEILAVCTKRRM